LLAPDFDPRLIEDILKGLDVLDGEASAEVAGGGGLGDAVGPEGVEEDDIVAPQFDIVEAGASTDCVVGEVEERDRTRDAESTGSPLAAQKCPLDGHADLLPPYGSMLAVLEEAGANSKILRLHPSNRQLATSWLL
jgi:hypothetical protein